MKGRIYEVNGRFILRFGRKITRTFKDRAEAERYLNGLRFKTDEGSFDLRDYAPGRPLSFSNLADQWLSSKEKRVKRRSFNNLKNTMRRASTAWGHSNIKNIGYAEIQDFLFGIEGISEKTRSNIKSALHDFWAWLLKRKVISGQQFPEFPEIPFELGMRRIVDIDTQRRILDEVRRISYEVNPKTWIGVKWLSTYISLRPGELIRIQEKHIDHGSGSIFIPHPKEKKPKMIYLLEEDLRLLRELPRGLPELYFFRHPPGISGIKPGEPFGPRYLYKWWKKACSNLGIEGVDLYGGTRHSTTTALSEMLTPEQIRGGTMHSTNRAFERYFQKTARDALKVYQVVEALNKKGGP